MNDTLNNPTQELDIRERAPLADFTTFRLGGPCRRLITCTTPEILIRTARELADLDDPFLLIGGGSNLLVSDEGYDGTVLRYWSRNPHVNEDGDDWIVSGSTLLDDFVHLAADRGQEGLTCCTGIPGTVGGAIIGNAGAWGRQIGDRLVSVTVLELDSRVRDLDAEVLDFGYRSSALKENGAVVLSARFRLAYGSSAALLKQREQILRQRREKHPDPVIDPCIGSFFRNLEPSSKAGARQAAGWFLEKAGAKEMTVGGARVFPRHANIIVKGPGCTAQDVRDLASRMKDAVEEMFGFALRREVRYLGRFRGDEGQPADRFF